MKAPHRNIQIAKREIRANEKFGHCNYLILVLNIFFKKFAISSNDKT